MSLPTGSQQASNSRTDALNGAGGSGQQPGTSSRFSVPGGRQGAFLLLPVVLAAGTALFFLQGRGIGKPAGSSAPLIGAARKSASAKKRPRNLVRYYGIGALISLLERDATRKALIVALKWARQRA